MPTNSLAGEVDVIGLHAQSVTEQRKRLEARQYLTAMAMKDVHEVERSSKLARVDAPECELAVGVVERARRLERDADFVGRDQALSERVVGHRRDAVGDGRDECACAAVSA